MHYLLAAPFTWILLLLIVAFFVKSKRWKKRLFISSLIVFLVFSNKALYNLVIKWWQPAPVDLTGKKYETAVLLGGMGWMQQGNNSYFGNAADRFIQANKLYHQGIVKRIVVSAGGDDSTHKEAPFLKKQLVAAGVNPRDILTEEKSVDTYENGVYSEQVIRLYLLHPPFVLITSAFHMPRAQKVFKKAGIDVVPYPCDFEATNRKLSATAYFLPNVEVLNSWGGLIKEWLGLMVYKMQGKI